MDRHLLIAASKPLDETERHRRFAAKYYELIRSHLERVIETRNP